MSTPATAKAARTAESRRLRESFFTSKKIYQPRQAGGSIGRSISKADTDGPGGPDKVTVRVYQLGACRGLGKVYALHLRLPQAHHAAELAPRNQIYRRHAEAGAENAVERRWRGAPLDVAKHGYSYFTLQAHAQGIPDQVPRCSHAQPGAPFLSVSGVQVFGNLHAFGHYYDGEPLAMLGAHFDELAHLVHAERNLGNKNHVGATGNTGLQRNPAGVAAHDLNQHGAVVRFGGVVGPF